MFQLMNRDYDLLKVISDLKYLRLDQIQRLFFPSAQRARERVRKLIVYHFLRCETVASIEIYMLGKAGVELFPDRSRKKPNILWLNHSLAINQFYIDLKLYCEDSYYIRLAKFIPEYNINFEAFYHRADAGINLFSRLLNKPFFFFLEVDRSTESLERLKEMLYGYYLLFYYNDFRLLIVCDSTRRLNNIRKFMADQFETLFYHFCWMKTAEAPLSHWKSLDIKDKKDYDIKRDIVTRAAHSLRMERSAAECRAV